MHAYHVYICTNAPIINVAMETWLGFCVKGLAELLALARPTASHSVECYQVKREICSLNSLEKEVALANVAP